jgi:predicted nucleic acid-binding protein
MIWLLDTNVISDLWKPHPNPAVVAWLEENKDDCALLEIIRKIGGHSQPRRRLRHAKEPPECAPVQDSSGKTAARTSSAPLRSRQTAIFGS